MRARTISALCVVITIFTGYLFTGCASTHKQFAYVVGQGTNEVFQFQVHQDGTLEALGTPNFPAGSNTSAVTPDTSRQFLYVANFAGNDLTLLDINQGNGNLSVPVSNSVVIPTNPPNIFNTDAGPIALVMSPTAPFLYVANQTSGDISAYTVDPGAGGLGTVQGSPFLITPATNPSAIAISPSGNLLFTANATQGTVAAFTISSTGQLAEVAGSPFSAGAGSTPVAIAVERTGRFLYVADKAHNAVVGFAIQNNGTIALLSGSPFATGASPAGLAVDPQGSLLYTANAVSNDVTGFAIDPNSGALGVLTGSPFPTGGIGPSGITVNSNTSVVYVTDQTTHDIAALGILSGGVLKPLAGSPFGVATAPTQIKLVVAQ